jgi:RimJ/RimL family protein N-acetyltransferase
MTVNFYQHNPEAPEHAPPSPKPHFRVRCWRPDYDGRPSGGSRRASNYFWWVLARTGRFKREGFGEIRIEQGAQLLHRLIVTPAWYRFPFMTPEDLQIGAVWTAPAARRKQLARIAIGEAHRRFGGNGTRFWYVTQADNLASDALARSCGYRLVGTGRRTRRFGTALLGQFVIDRYV